MREISLDTETTGLRTQQGHRIIEIGCVEIKNYSVTGNVFHTYLDPQRDVPEDSFKIHGISADFLKGKPKFSEKAQDFLDFIGDSKLVIHNAVFDIGFLNYELSKTGRKKIPEEQVFCTYRYAKKTFPGQKASLDALCKKFNIDNSARTKHGALLDAELLAAMYLEMLGRRQSSLSLTNNKENSQKNIARNEASILEAREHSATRDEITAHKEFLKQISNPLWNRLNEKTQ